MRNKSAFPESYGDPRNPGWIGGGITIRDYFAAKALSGVFNEEVVDVERAAKWCYEMADAMISEREKGETK